MPSSYLSAAAILMAALRAQASRAASMLRVATRKAIVQPVANKLTSKSILRRRATSAANRKASSEAMAAATKKATRTNKSHSVN